MDVLHLYSQIKMGGGGICSETSCFHVAIPLEITYILGDILVLLRIHFHLYNSSESHIAISVILPPLALVIVLLWTATVNIIPAILTHCFIYLHNVDLVGICSLYLLFVGCYIF